MRIYIWHGYLLRGTGSNEYTRALARTLAGRGHDVTVFCAETADIDLGGATVRRLRPPGRLPVFVLDAYEGMEPALLPEMPRAEVEQFVAAQVAAIRAEGPADLLITNHVLLGGPVGAGSGLPYVVKAHGSELEYAMRGNEALCSWARDSTSAAAAVIAGSEHVRDVLAEVTGIAGDQVVVIPPGVDTEQMRPQSRTAALQRLIDEARRDPPNPADRYDERAPDDGNAGRFADFFARSDQPFVSYVGKLSEQKGVSLLLEALRGLPARAVIVGFGPARADLTAQAAELGVEALFTGPLQHRHLANLWPLAAASAVPSVFPEAFGMVAAEAAACGCPPVVARHSGLAEIADGIEARLPPHLQLTSFERGDADDLRARLDQLLQLSPADMAVMQQGCRQAVEELWSWDSVADRIVGLGSPGRPV